MHRLNTDPASAEVMLAVVAWTYATAAHNAVKQVRKYTGEPYWVHPIAVSAIVDQVTEGNGIAVSAALLHDVVEDTGVTLDDLRVTFPEEVVKLVDELTNRRPEGLNRAARKELDRQRLAGVSPLAKTIKLADILDNAPTIIQHDPNFAPVWIEEQRLLLPYLTEGNSTLWHLANTVVQGFLLDRVDTTNS